MKALEKFLITLCYLSSVTVESTMLRFNPRSNVGLTPCENNADCEEYVNATCSEDKFCECYGSKICIEKQKNIVNKLGEKCSSSENCNIENSMCNTGVKKCVCDKNYIHSSDRRRCLPFSGGLGDNCEENIQCYVNVPYSECIENICVCRNHMHEYKGYCYKDVGFGKACALSEECALTNFSVCMNSKCTCAVGYIFSLSESECIPVAETINGTCKRNIQCTARLGQGALCRNGVCECGDLHQHKPTINKCVQYMLLGDICSLHTDCHQPGEGSSKLECVLGNCKCRSIYREVNGYCINSSKSLLNIRLHFVTCTILYFFKSLLL